MSHWFSCPWIWSLLFHILANYSWDDFGCSPGVFIDRLMMMVILMTFGITIITIIIVDIALP